MDLLEWNFDDGKELMSSEGSCESISEPEETFPSDEDEGDSSTSEGDSLNEDDFEDSESDKCNDSLDHKSAIDLSQDGSQFVPQCSDHQSVHTATSEEGSKAEEAESAASFPSENDDPEPVPDRSLTEALSRKTESQSTESHIHVEDIEGDDLEELVEQKREEFLKEKNEREEAIALRRTRSKSAPACSMSLPSPNSTAQRKRLEEKAAEFAPDPEKERVEYNPRDSSVTVPAIHAAEEMSEESDQGSEVAAEGCPWEERSVDSPVAKLDQLPSGRLKIRHPEMLRDLMKAPVPSKRLLKRSDAKASPKKPTIRSASRTAMATRFPSANQRRNCRSAQPTRKPPIKKEWNFDTSIDRPKPKRRPLTAAEINRKVRSLIERAPPHSSSIYRGSVDSVKPDDPVYVNDLLSSISEANRIAKQLGGRYRYRLDNNAKIEPDVYVDVFDCEHRRWIQPPYSLSKFLKRHALLKKKSSSDSEHRIKAWLSGH